MIRCICWISATAPRLWSRTLGLPGLTPGAHFMLPLRGE